MILLNNLCMSMYKIFCYLDYNSCLCLLIQTKMFTQGWFVDIIHWFDPLSTFPLFNPKQASMSLVPLLYIYKHCNPFSVVTVNDYLAQRDAKWMGRVHCFLGLTVGLIEVYFYIMVLSYFLDSLIILAWNQSVSALLQYFYINVWSEENIQPSFTLSSVAYA